ncbi:ATP-binding protein [uncultured Thiohalocapsa sp.]|uniref:ATP-binding protein n=1 Tax=uncultured Thiohalocapsa sp. TaxID=768990 RepID=UPI0025E4C63C|nr:ATP-binding protein [uncultured Thiohalocapsa sp.]
MKVMVRNGERDAPARAAADSGRQRFLGAWLRGRRGGERRGDSEREQAIIRLVLGGIVVLYMVTAGSEGADAQSVATVRWVGGLFLLAAAVLLLAALRGLGPAYVRRSFGILLDLSGTSLMMAVSGESGAPLLGIYLWVIVGNGFRYDTRYLALATALSVIGFSLAALSSPYWHAHPFFALSYLLVLLIIPSYVAALLGKLHRAVRQAEAASSAKSRFLAKMSHELRTPLNGVIGVSDLLLDADLRGQERELVRTIHASGRTLLGIIDNILDFSKIEAGRINIAPAQLDLRRLVSETVAMFGAEARRKGIALDTHLDPRLPPAVRGDPLHIRQVLMNLLGNAVKFTESGGVTVRVLCADDDAASSSLDVRFEVEDTGIGIAIADQPHIFESFRQANPGTARRYGGTGLGTAIARELVRLMDGRIGFRSSAGEGSLFWFELPLARVPLAAVAGAADSAEAPDDPAAAAMDARGSAAAGAAENILSLTDHHRRQAPGRGLKVLVAEDNDANRRVLRAVLERAGHRLVMVEDGEAALDVLEAQGGSLDLLVLDKNMPGRCGLEVFRAQRFMYPQDPIPTIILSADATDAALAEARDAGVDAYLTKPVEGRRLLDSIARVARAAAGDGGADSTGAHAAMSAEPNRSEPPQGSAVGGDEPLLDPHKLASLRGLDAGSGFFEQLVSGFREDAERAVDGVAEALRDADYPALRRALHALEGSAVELGARRLVGAARRLRSLRPFELDSAQARRLLGELREILATTLQALGQPQPEAPAHRQP